MPEENVKCLAVFRVCRICRICPLCVRQQTVPLCVVMLKLCRSWFISLQVTKASLMLSGQRLRQKIAFGAQPQQPLSCWIPHCLRPWLFLTMSFTRQAAATANSIPRQNVLVMISALFWFEFQGKVDARSTRAWVSLNTLIYFDYIYIDNCRHRMTWTLTPFPLWKYVSFHRSTGFEIWLRTLQHL